MRRCLRLTARYDATERAPRSCGSGSGRRRPALAALEPQLREAMEIAAANVRAVAEAQLQRSARVTCPRARRCGCARCRSRAAGIYAPGGSRRLSLAAC